MSEKKVSMKNNDAPLEKIRVGEVEAQIFSKKSNSGFCYFGFKLTRIFLSSTSKESHGLVFFEHNEQDIILAARKAATWIHDKELAEPQNNHQDSI